MNIVCSKQSQREGWAPEHITPWHITPPWGSSAGIISGSGWAHLLHCMALVPEPALFALRPASACAVFILRTRGRICAQAQPGTSDLEKRRIQGHLLAGAAAPSWAQIRATWAQIRATNRPSGSRLGAPCTNVRSSRFVRRPVETTVDLTHRSKTTRKTEQQA